MPTSYQIFPVNLLPQYKTTFPTQVQTAFDQLKDSELSMETFSFYTSVSAVFSSKIEGEEMELDSFIKHKRLGVHYQPDYTKKIDDLYDAYLFAQLNALNSETLLQAHKLITKNILHESLQGAYRKGNMYVVTKEGKIEYIAAPPDKVNSEMNKFWSDTENLLKTDLTFEEVFFFASLLHLVFIKIHPFEDGNGRTARLLEKWFLAQKLGNKSWFIQSEKYYYEQHQGYYNNIRQLGLEYELLDNKNAGNFLNMLMQSLIASS